MRPLPGCAGRQTLVAQQDRELVSSVADGNVVWSGADPHQLTDPPQHLVAAVVAVGVIDRLEAVEIDEQECGSAQGPSCAVLQPGVEATAVVQPGERIGMDVAGQSRVLRTPAFHVDLRTCRGEDSRA